MTPLFICTMLSVFSLIRPSIAAEQITVAAAANLQFTLEDIRKGFIKDAGIEINLVIGSSGKLTGQIENGAPFDVFLSADTDFPKRLDVDGLTIGHPQVYAIGHLVLWSMKEKSLSNGVAGLADPLFSKIAVASPKAAPYGRAAVDAMKQAGLYPAIQKKLVYGESIAQVNQFITSGAVEAGFTAKSVVLSANMKDKGVWLDVDPALYSSIAQALVILKYSQKEHAADTKAFVDYLFSPQAQEIFKKYGYTLP